MSRLSYSSSLTIPAGTTRSAPASDTLEVPPGRLKLVRIVVPPGPRGEVSLWLTHQTHQLLPVPPGVYDNLDDDLIEEEVDYLLETNETTLTLYGISPNANFLHTVSWGVSVEQSEPITAPLTSASITQRLASLFGG